MPVTSVSIAEEEVGGIGLENVEGQLAAWNYFQTLDSPENAKFVEDFKAKYRPGPRDLRSNGGRLHLAVSVEGDG